MDINERNIKIWSTIGPRATLGITVLDLAKDLENLMVLTCDVSTSAGLDRFRKLYPEKYIDLGIAEQNMIGVAAGLSSEGYNVVTTTFAPFQTMRCCEQIKVNLGYMKQKICMVGIASGLALGALGFTHCCIEDVGVLRSIPGITIISPADSLETAKALEAAVKLKGPSYIRLTGESNNPIVYNKDYTFEIGKSIKLNEGSDVTIFSAGAMVHTSLEVAKILEKKKYHVQL
jgi:transketolase